MSSEASQSEERSCSIVWWYVREHPICKNLFISLHLCVCPNQMHASPLKTLLSATHLLQGAAKLEADGAEAFKAGRPVD